MIEWNMCEGGGGNDEVLDVPKLFELGNLTHLKKTWIFKLIHVAEYFGVENVAGGGLVQDD